MLFLVCPTRRMTRPEPHTRGLGGMRLRPARTRFTEPYATHGAVIPHLPLKETLPHELRDTAVGRILTLGSTVTYFSRKSCTYLSALLKSKMLNTLQD